MDANGIDRGLVIQIYEAPSSEEGLTEGRSTYDASGGRLHPVVTVDPTRGKEKVSEALALWDRDPRIVGVKLFPGYLPFYPHDPRLAPVYEWAHRKQLPVLVHQGDTLDRKGLVKFARPIELDEVAVRYSDVRFVLCHLGNPWVDEAAEVVYKNENVYADTSGLLAHPSAPYFEKMVEQCRRRVLQAIVAIGSSERILYGSDWPLEELRLAVGLVDGLDLPLADRERILGENARRLFRLPPPPLPPAESS